MDVVVVVVVVVTPRAAFVGTNTTFSRLSGVRVEVVVVTTLDVNVGTHTPPPLVFPESGWMLLLLLLLSHH